MKYDKLIQWLDKVASGDLSEVYNKIAGLCDNANSFCGADLLDLFENVVDLTGYDEYSGCNVFPVGNGHDDYMNNENLYTGKYGKERMRFAGWLADELRKVEG